MKNPFVYGETVEGANFADREDEIKMLSRDLKDAEKIFLISPRRYGKTSLTANVLTKLKKEGIATVYIDLYKATSLHKFLELYTREIARSVETKLERILAFIKEVLPGLRPKVTIDAEGSSSISLDYVHSKSEMLRYLDQVYDLPQKLALKKKKNFVIAFDEFQEIRNFNGDSVEKAMRASFQHQHNVAYLFAGSKKHILHDMVFNENRAFYKIGKVINLKKISREYFSPFIEANFKKSGFVLEKGLIEKILDAAEDYPYNTQFLCHELWDMNLDQRKINLDDITRALNKIISEENPFYLSLWDSLTLPQRDLLRAMAQFGGRKIFSKEFMDTTGLGPVSTIQTSLDILIKKNIVEKDNSVYDITDVFFKRWIVKETS